MKRFATVWAPFREALNSCRNPVFVVHNEHMVVLLSSELWTRARSAPLLSVRNGGKLDKWLCQAGVPNGGKSFMARSHAEVYDWLTSDQDITGSRVSWDTSGHSANGSLKVNTSLWGSQNPDRPQPKHSTDAYTHTEAVLYFKHPPAIHDFSGYNFSGQTATCWVFVPESVDPEGIFVSIFVKSYDPQKNNYANQDGSNVSVSNNRGTWFPLSLTIGNFEPSAYHDPDFNPTRVAALGVLIQSDPASRFNGKNIEWSIDDYTIS